MSDEPMRRWPPTLRRVAMALALALCACKGETGATSGATIDVSGGSASAINGRGGSGGSIFMHAREPRPGDLGIEVRPDGRVDTRLALASLPPADTGSNGLVVDRETLVSSIVFTEPPAGTLYMVKEESLLFVSDGDGLIEDEAPVTGLVVKPGGRLVLPHHFTHLESNRVSVVFTDDIVNDGEITATDLPTMDRGSFALSSVNGGYRGAGDLLAHGLRPGQGGGDISLFLETGGFNDGDWLAHGGGDASGGRISIQTSITPGVLSSFENTGRLDARGGAASGPLGRGGDGGAVLLVANTHLLNTGKLDASGGDGGVIAGTGGSISVQSSFAGDFVNEGVLTVDGGLAPEGFLGGDGGEIQLFLFGGAVRSTGDLLARGGSGAQEVGGSGGSISILMGAEPVAPGAAPGQPAGPIEVSGRMLASGADGLFTGGRGGSIETVFLWFAPEPSAGQRCSLRGQRRVSAAGGSGYDGGGKGGVVIFDTASDGGSPLGPVVVGVPVDASGGDAGDDGLDRDGGSGGLVELRGITVERGEIDVSGGAGTLAASDGTVLEIFP